VRTIDVAGEEADLGKLLARSARADYVYMYPPRQCYRTLRSEELDTAVDASLARPGPLNLYMHFPFCAQICAFCNLFAVAGSSAAEHAAYLRMLERELEHYAPHISGRPVDTLYLGGGTPSLLSPELFVGLFDLLLDLGVCDVRSVPEVAIEMSPDTATPERLGKLRDTGINRVNLGVQSWEDEELRLIGRRYNSGTPLAALDAALGAGFDNVCVDLIYGLQGQSDASWARSVDAVIARRPQTVCAYPLTLRPRTGFSARGYVQLADEQQYARYDYANAALLEAGYRQETHVRWVLAGGGYRQKSNHWGGQDVLGIGAGARGYLWYVDYRNGYSVRARRRALRAWEQRVHERGHGRVQGFLMDDDERRRKAVILGLNGLDREHFKVVHGMSVDQAFRRQLDGLKDAGLLVDDGQRLKLTSLGVRFRDVAVQAFFSPRVRALLADFDYDE
jgi:oxygen-independent coproporphyrinogen III oxidase